MEEWNEQQLLHWIQSHDERKFVYLFTPLCGTCKVTERMLQVVTAMLPELQIVKCNINFCPDLARSWKVESVPCVASVYNHNLTHKKYRMQSVDELLYWFQEIEMQSAENG